mgnify:CR=1 FL=1
MNGKKVVVNGLSYLKLNNLNLIKKHSGGFRNEKESVFRIRI